LALAQDDGEEGERISPQKVQVKKAIFFILEEDDG
jgi:hypothetical protein